MTPVGLGRQRVAPAEAHLAALAGLAGMGPRQLGALLEAHAEPEAAWATVVAGTTAADPAVASVLGRDPSARAAGWAAQARAIEPGELFARHRAAGVTLLTPWHPAWPARLADDPEPPAMLCTRGDPAALAGPACALVGTRTCTGEGRRTAHDIGRDLADAGVAVVSGLALGIDGAAHRGALAAGPGAGGPVGVVAGGVDVGYPPSHRSLFDEVAAAGALVSEAPSAPRPSGGASRPATASSPPWPTWWWSSRATTEEGPCTPSTPPSSGAAPSAPCRARCAARPAPAPTPCWPIRRSSCATRTTCWWPSGWGTR